MVKALGAGGSRPASKSSEKEHARALFSVQNLIVAVEPNGIRIGGLGNSAWCLSEKVKRDEAR